jgi:hypothetical protein
MESKYGTTIPGNFWVLGQVDWYESGMLTHFAKQNLARSTNSSPSQSSLRHFLMMCGCCWRPRDRLKTRAGAMLPGGFSQPPDSQRVKFVKMECDAATGCAFIQSL